MKYNPFFGNEIRVRRLADSSVLKKEIARAHSDVVQNKEVTRASRRVRRKLKAKSLKLKWGEEEGSFEFLVLSS